MRLQWLFGVLVLSLALLFSEIYILAHDLFWHIRWLDTPMHVLGGMALGSFVAIIVGARPRAYWGILVALFIVWEIFEFVAGVPQLPENIAFDTANDLVNDIIGGVLVYVFAQATLWRSA